MSAVTVRPEELAALAAGLTALAAELAGDAEDCRAAAHALGDALPGPEGWRAGGVATAVAGLLGAVAGNATALAGTLSAALGSYRELDASLAGSVDAFGPTP